MAEEKKPWYKKELTFLPVSKVDVVTMTKNFSIMLEAGLTVPESLEVLVEQSGGRLKKILKKVYSEVQSGELLGDALEPGRRVFGPIFVSSVKVGESSGTLSQNLTYVASQMDRELEVLRNIQGAMLYPAIIVIATFILGFALATFVLPQMSKLFKSLDIELPWTTRLLIWIADVFEHYGLLITPILIGLFIFLFFFFFRKFMEPVTHRFLLLLPGVSNFVHDINRARFCRSIGTMLQSGIPIQEGLGIVRGVMTNYLYRNSVEHMYTSIESGASFAELVAKYPHLYPKMVERMIVVGERSGSMADTLIYLAKFYEEKVAIKAKNLASIIEPVLLIFF
ncbi:type II secretion system F family protein [Candidatus Uhrbacteria bacterium]|nr:type II secretion system F family protein [Candidatus Uhrbacteria bacterium]